MPLQRFFKGTIAAAALTASASAADCKQQAVTVEMIKGDKHVSTATQILGCAKPSLFKSVDQSTYHGVIVGAEGKTELSKTVDAGVILTFIPVAPAKYHVEYTISDIKDVLRTDEMVWPLYTSNTDSMIVDFSYQSRVSVELGEFKVTITPENL